MRKISIGVEDNITQKFAQLEAIVDLFAVALDPSNSAVFKKNTLYDSIWLVEDLIVEIRYLFKESIKSEAEC